MPDMSAIANPQQRQFNPYTENGGTILAVAGADFTVIAGDTRQSEGYSIQTRYAPKVFRLYVLFFFERKKLSIHSLTRRLEPTALYSP
jgi:20S proteasome alpha/beta subunit